MSSHTAASRDQAIAQYYRNPPTLHLLCRNVNSKSPSTVLYTSTAFLWFSGSGTRLLERCASFRTATNLDFLLAKRFSAFRAMFNQI